MVKNKLQVFSSFDEAEQADHRYYASLSPRERLDIVFELVARHQEPTLGTTEGFERVYRVTDLE